MIINYKGRKMVRNGEFSRDPHRDLAALRISAQNLGPVYKEVE